MPLKKEEENLKPKRKKKNKMRKILEGKKSTNGDIIDFKD